MNVIYKSLIKDFHDITISFSISYIDVTKSIREWFANNTTIHLFNEEILLIKEKFMKTDFPLSFMKSVINEFQKGKNHGDEIFIIQPVFLGITKPYISYNLL